MKPKLVIENEVYRKVMHWVNKSEYEVSGLGMVRVEKDGVLRVVSAMLLPQKNGSTHTDIEAEEVNKAMYELRESEGDLRWWWHSHVNMGVFWSGTDMDTIRKIGAGGWFASSVFNKKNEVKSSYYGVAGMSTPWGTAPLFLDDLTTESTTVEDPRVAEWDKEYETNVTNQRYPSMGSVASMHDHGWVKTEHGVWARTSGESQTQTSTDTGPGATTIDPTVEPPESRPPGMTKREYKLWKRQYREFMEGMSVTATGNYSVDEYGFDPNERISLDQLGWEEDDLDDAITHGLTPSQLVLLADANMEPREVRWLFANGWTADDMMADIKLNRASQIEMDDVPVHDRRYLP